jgi:hypothetical protein
MTQPTPPRPTMDDDLDQAYARAHALADDGRGPSASVRANVLAAAARIAAGDDGAVVPPLVPIAPPVADVGRGRARAINLSSWRVRSGAALCAMLLVGLALWRFDDNGRLGGDVQVAQAELRLAQPQAAPVPRDLPLPAAAAASYLYAAPPAVVEDPLDNGSSGRGAAAKKAERDKDVVVAQLEKERSVARRTAPSADAIAPPGTFQPAAPAAPGTADIAAKPAPVVVASNAPRAEAAAPPPEESTTVTSRAAAAPPQVVTSPPRAPSVLPRRVLLVPQAPPAPAAAAPVDPSAPAGSTTVAAAEPDRKRAKVAELAEERTLSKASASDSAPPSAAGSLAGASAVPHPLQAAAGRGDVEALRRLLADPAARVDTPDADGRTALLAAVLAQQPAAVRLLLEAGADPGRADRAGLTPRAAAQAGANAEIAALLAVPR